MSPTAALEALMGQMAQMYRAGDADGIAGLFTADGRIDSPFGPPAIGRDAIAELHRDWTAEPNDKTFTLLDSGGNGDLAWGLFRFAEGAQTGTGTSLAVFQREADGAWRVRSCCLFEEEAG